jgi:hypothetical protein
LSSLPKPKTVGRSAAVSIRTRTDFERDLLSSIATVSARPRAMSTSSRTPSRSMNVNPLMAPTSAWMRSVAAVMCAVA